MTVKDRVLALLREQPELNAMEISAKIGVQGSRLHLKKMEDEGLIEIGDKGAWIIKLKCEEARRILTLPIKETKAGEGYAASCHLLKCPTCFKWSMEEGKKYA